MSDLASLKRRAEEEEVASVDFRVSDLVGRFRHLTIPVRRLSESVLYDGIGFDGSNLGYRHVAGSDMVLVPDLSTAYIEERSGERVLTLIADIADAETRAPAALDPRRTITAALRYLTDRGIADEVLVSPEFEYYVFGDVRYAAEATWNGVEIEPIEGGRESGGAERSLYHAPIEQDRLFPLRSEIVRQIEAAGIPVKYHHHEVGPYGQQEIELDFDGLARMADATLIVKSIVHNVASEAGVTATFLPKPMYGQAGNGMHLHQYLVRGGENLFYAEAGLSETARCYIGGLLTHGASLMAWTNPSTNSYRRLVPGYEAPVRFTYGASNRTAAVRIPAYARDDKTRIELRTMDATCNPYLAYAAILMAGVDGIQRGLDARELGFGPLEADTDAAETGTQAPADLDGALDALEGDAEYLTVGGVFSEALIELWIRAKRNEASAVAARPHPQEFSLYYDL